MFAARNLIHTGATKKGLAVLRGVVDGGYHSDVTFERDPWLDPVRENARFVDIVRRAREGREASEQAYADAGGVTLLGPGLAATG
jgi:hypothetical protein